MSPRVLALAVALVAVAPRAAAQQPPPNSAAKLQPVKPTATVEVLDDTAHVDDVISRLKRPPAPAGEATTPAADPAAAAAESQLDDLKADRPDLALGVLEKERQLRERLERLERLRARERAEHVGKAP